jgi:phthalate 4,5-dioxygenase oxygenase subunit
MLTAQQNERLVRVEGEAPMGKLMREHYWIPALLSSQIVADSTPQRVRLLGKDYVAFRATDGRVGFFDERCPHRGVSLALARNEKCGLRCIFHGWKIDVSGKVVDVPTHTPDPELFAARVKVNHYPVHEGGGIVWVWLGAKAAPTFPELPFTVLPASRVWMTVTKAYCNWLQGVEATIDTAHIGTLHEAYIARRRDKGDQANTANLAALAPRYECRKTAYGLDAAGLREMPDGSTYVRTTRYFMPFVAITPGGSEVPGVIFIASPIDDYHHNMFFGTWSRTGDINNGKDVPAFMSDVIGDLPYDPHNFGRFTAGRDAAYGQNRAAMKDGHFSGFTGNLLQEDMVTQASMGPIVDRTLDHLSSSDVAIVRAQQMLLRSLEDMEEGRMPPGAGDNLDWRNVVPDNMLIPAGKDADNAIDFFKAAS